MVKSKKKYFELVKHKNEIVTEILNVKEWP